jgi:hypothetical protein
MEARRQIPNVPLLATIALGADALRNTSQVEELLENSDDWPVDGIYLVTEHPAGSYLVDDPQWIANKLDIVAHQRLAGRRLVAGYCTHQMLVLAAGALRELGSGTWMNVRSFDAGKFDAIREEEIRQRATWYFCPQALSEYKLPYLDIADRQGVLQQMQPDAALGSVYADPVFAGGQPSVSGFGEPAAFRHYLQCFRSLAATSTAPSFDQTTALHRRALDRAEHLLRDLGAAGVTAQLREFARCIDANRAALTVLDSTRGPVLRRRWSSL